MKGAVPFLLVIWLLILSENSYALVCSAHRSNVTLSMFAGEEASLFTFSVNTEKNATLELLVRIDSLRNRFPVERSDFKLRVEIGNRSAECKFREAGLFVCEAPLNRGKHTLRTVAKANPALYESLYRFTLVVLGEVSSKITKKLNITANSAQSVAANFTTVTLVPKTNLTNVTITLVEFSTRSKIDDERVIIKGAEIDASGLSNFSATIRLCYTDEEIAGISERSLRIARYSFASDEWEELDTRIYADENCAEASVTGFSVFGVIGRKLAAPSLPAPSGGGGGGGSAKLPGKECELDFDISVPSLVRARVNETVVIPIRISVANPCGKSLTVKLVSPAGTRYLYFTSLKENEVRESSVVFIFEHAGIYPITVESCGVKKQLNVVVREEKTGAERNLTALAATTTTVARAYHPEHTPAGFLIAKPGESLTAILVGVLIIILTLLIREIIRRWRHEDKR